MRPFGLLVRALIVAAAGATLVVAAPARAVTAGSSCGIQTMRDERGIEIRVLFAKNGSVQRYEVVHSQGNTEAANDFLIKLERQYGAAGVDAPPLKIISYKAGSAGGMLIPDKAIDSCSRTISFF